MRLLKQVTFLSALMVLATACAGGTSTPETAIVSEDEQGVQAQAEQPVADIVPVTSEINNVHTEQPQQAVAPAPEPEFTTDGLTLTAADAWLGSPDLLRVEKQGHIRRYAGLNCQLYMVVYNDRIDHIEAWNTESGRQMNADECGRGLARLAAR